MEINDSCVFQIGRHMVKCECWEGYDDKKAYAVTVYKLDGVKYREMYHSAMHDKPADNYEEAKDCIRYAEKMAEFTEKYWEKKRKTEKLD